MTILAVIDLGSNSVRMTISHFHQLVIMKYWNDIKKWFVYQRIWGMIKFFNQRQ